MLTLKIDEPFSLESGEVLPELTIAYHTYGRLNARRDNVVWVCHALTANSDAADWWEGLVGAGKLIDPARYFVVCANMLGSNYGSTSPTSMNPLTGEAYGLLFPLITVRDMVKAHIALRKHLGVKEIHLLIGGSMGGQQALEWAIVEPRLVQHLVLLACGARQSAWGVALNEAQRMALKADPTFGLASPEAGGAGLEAARAIGMVSYRSYESFNAAQSDTDGRADDFRAASYQRYQGWKLRKRFHALNYWSLTRSMDSHDVSRGRGALSAVLGQVRARTMVIGISSDVLFPPSEQAQLARLISNASLRIIDSMYGHDGFLLEYAAISEAVSSLLKHTEHEGAALETCAA